MISKMSFAHKTFMNHLVFWTRKKMSNVFSS